MNALNDLFNKWTEEDREVDHDRLIGAKQGIETAVASKNLLFHYSPKKEKENITVFSSE